MSSAFIRIPVGYPEYWPIGILSGIPDEFSFIVSTPCQIGHISVSPEFLSQFFPEIPSADEIAEAFGEFWSGIEENS